MAQGTVKWFDPKKGYGFIVNQEGKDVFVHYTEIDGSGFKHLKDGQLVEYEQIIAAKGLYSRKVRIIRDRTQNRPSLSQPS